MFKTNEANWDRILRVVVGILFLYLGLGNFVAGSLGVVVDVVGVLLVLTGLAGFCPIYALLKLSTKKA
jgi:hypothetical protein